MLKALNKDDSLPSKAMKAINKLPTWMFNNHAQPSSVISINSGLLTYDESMLLDQQLYGLDEVRKPIVQIFFQEVQIVFGLAKQFRIG